MRPLPGAHAAVVCVVGALSIGWAPLPNPAPRSDTGVEEGGPAIPATPGPPALPAVPEDPSAQEGFDELGDPLHATPDSVQAEPGDVEDAVPDDELDANPPPAPSPLLISGYVDVGYANAQGNGTSFRPGDTRAPADYGVDTFAPAVNSRGEVASTDSRGVFTNGFLPRSAGIGGTPSFLLNTADFDFRYTAPEWPVMVFTRVQLFPSFEPSGGSPSEYGGLSFEQLVTRVFLEQAFGRVTPLKGAELTISIGKFDSVFGIEYLDNQANFRVGITPSLMARYTTGQSVGAKVFYRYQFPEISAAATVNGAATNSGTFVESLQAPDRSLTGAPVWSGRLGFEMNLAKVSVKLGASGVRGPRNDQFDRSAEQALWGIDARIILPPVTLSGEFVNVSEGESSIPGKLTGLGMFPVASGFYARGFWIQASDELPLPNSPFRLTFYGRYERRHAAFRAFIPVTVDRITFGLNVGIWDSLQVKGEMLINRELEGAPQVDNNVYTSSVVWTW
jgi:hypothetical protein